MIVLVYGGRDYDNVSQVNLVLTDLWVRKGITKIIHGDARGADTLGRQWAEWIGIEVHGYPADWYPNGVFFRGAGIIRNATMLAEGKPDYGVGFPGGRGTADMTRRLKAAGIPFEEIMH